MCLVSCDILNQFIPQDPTPEHIHSFGEWSVTKNATCTEDGVKVRYCDCGEKQSENIPANGHIEVVDEAVTPTCTDVGKSEGKHCSICNQVIHAQSVVPMLSHTYGEWIVTKTANCGQDGEMTRFCSCGAKQTEVIYGAGMHTEIIDPAVNVTCTQDGLTEGMHCSVCNTIIIAQNIIPASHRYSDEYEYNDEYHWLKCIDCGDENISLHNANDEGMCSVCDKPIGATEGIIYDKSDDGTYVMVVGYTGIAKKVKIADTYQGLPVKTIYQNAFKDNNAVTSVIIPDSVTYIGNSAFYGCSNLTSIVFGDSVTVIGDFAFYKCDQISSVVIPDSVTSIGESAFDCCHSLTSVVIPDSVTYIGRQAFYLCSSLTSVVIGNGVTSIGSYAFYYCPNLQFNEYENCRYLGTKDNPYHTLIEVTTQNLISYTIHEDTKVIAGAAFYSCSRLESIVILDGVVSIGDDAFSNCEFLTSVEIGNSVTSIGVDTFSSCRNLTSVVIPDSVTYIGRQAFHNCSSLTSVVIGNGVASIGNSAFSRCSNLASIVIGDSLVSIGDWVFYSCSSLRDVYYTGDMEEWKTISIGSYNDDFENATKHYNYVPEN